MYNASFHQLSNMKLFTEPSPRQKFIRQNLARLVIYGGFGLVMFWIMSELVERQERTNAPVQRIEDAVRDSYRQRLTQ